MPVISVGPIRANLYPQAPPYEVLPSPPHIALKLASTHAKAIAFFAN